MSWKLVLSDQIGSWGCKGRIYYGGQSYNVDDPEVINAASSVRHISILPGDADVEAWKLEQALAAAPALPAEPEPEGDFVANTGEVIGDEDPPVGEGESEDPVATGDEDSPVGEGESEDPSAEGDMRSELEAALAGGDGGSEPLETPGNATAKEPLSKRRQRRAAG